MPVISYLWSLRGCDNIANNSYCRTLFGGLRVSHEGRWCPHFVTVSQLSLANHENWPTLHSLALVKSSRHDSAVRVVSIADHRRVETVYCIYYRVIFHQAGPKYCNLWISTRGPTKSMQILLSNSQAGPGRTVKQEQEEISRNYVQTFSGVPVQCIREEKLW